MAITASTVKELRELTGAGMMDCKKALTQTDGDMEKAVEFLREKGLAASLKKAGRIAAEGIVTVLVNDNKGVIVEVNSETDFVARNDKFKDFVNNVAKQILDSNADSVEQLKEEKWILDDTKTVAEELSSQIAVIGENLNIRRFAKLENSNGVISSYIHGEGRIGILLDVDTDAKDNEEVNQLLLDICMQIAAMNPKYISREEISKEFIDNEREILLAQAKNENQALPEGKRKPDNIIEKMIEGRLTKQLKEICLIDQAFVKEDKVSVGQHVANVAKKCNCKIQLKKFVRYETGEGIEKKEDDFASEVAAQMGM